MLVNRELREYGYIFTNNVDPLYLKMLVNLGSKPIFIYIKDNKRIISEGIFINDRPTIQLQWEKYIKYFENWCDLNNYSTFDFDYLTISEIKFVLSMKVVSPLGIPIYPQIKPFYFFDI